MAGAMGDSQSRTIPSADVRELWERYRAGHVVGCPNNDGSALALSIEGSSKLYRLTCTGCGLSSRWFEVGEGGKLVSHGEAGWDS